MGELRLRGRLGEQVEAAHDLVDALERVVDDGRQVVGGHAVRAAHDEVVDSSGVGAVQLVEHGPLGRGGGQAQRGGAPQSGQSLNVAAGAVALEDEPARGQRRQGGLVRVGPLGLDEGLAVPVDSDRRQVLDLALGGPRAFAVDVLDA
ncbi:Uncharacterised protein [Mycobacteroides abscessus subsp. abscessus]|nr:Uncharacterised protein [Mycobacteroides abscessus subsp. abscessus]